MKALVEIEKSFDDEGSRFAKTYEAGDFKEFFKAEGGYLDNLSATAEKHGKAGDTFTVTYTVTVTK